MGQPTRSIVPSADSRKFLRRGYALSLASLIVACGTTATTQQNVTPSLPDQAQVVAPSQNNLGTPDGTASALVSPAAATLNDPTQTPVLIWWPAELYPTQKSPAASVIAGELNGYQKATGTTVTIRVKRNDGVGSIYEALSSGSVAAPSVMHDLALKRSDDLIKAVGGKLIEPLDLKALSMDDLYPSGFALGQVNGIQYGLPFALEVEHTVYRTAAFTSPPRSTTDLINTGQPLLFAAATAKGVNRTFLQQYLAARGTQADSNGAPTLDAAALREVLRYYEQAVSDRIVGPTLLVYTDAAQYWPDFLAGKINVVVIDSTTYLAQQPALANVGIEPVLMTTQVSASPISSVDGWLWVVTTPNPNRQARALSVLGWFMAPDHQGAFTQAFGVLPSRRTAFTAWTDTKYAAFAGTLLGAKAAPPPDLIDSVVAAALQKAFEDVLSGRKTSDEATNDSLGPVTAPK